mmetsp:Transcript_38468/g.81576  ORF Transcript_38468/g.81576 Transcript_38468/m.81576 type:complete len:220 (-) Transcript_38468:280-939(-)
MMYGRRMYIQAKRASCEPSLNSCTHTHAHTQTQSHKHTQHPQLSTSSPGGVPNLVLPLHRHNLLHLLQPLHATRSRIASKGFESTRVPLEEAMRELLLRRSSGFITVFVAVAIGVVAVVVVGSSLAPARGKTRLAQKVVVDGSIGFAAGCSEAVLQVVCQPKLHVSVSQLEEMVHGGRVGGPNPVVRRHKLRGRHVRHGVATLRWAHDVQTIRKWLELH